MIKRHVKYKNELIPYYIIRSKNKNMQLKISTDGDLQLWIPRQMHIGEVEVIMEQHLRLLYNRFQYVKRKKINGNFNNTKEYNTGDEIRILGDIYIINLIESSEKNIYLKDQQLVLSINGDSSPAERLNLIKKYMYNRAKFLFVKIMEEVYEDFKEYEIAFPKLTIREMKTRWGSCSVNKGKISLNLALMQLPIDVIKLVVVHEFCHFIQPNHSKKFYLLMDKYLPDWQTRKKRLDTLGSTRIS